MARYDEIFALIQTAMLDHPPDKEQTLLGTRQLPERSSVVAELEGDETVRLP